MRLSHRQIRTVIYVLVILLGIIYALRPVTNVDKVTTSEMYTGKIRSIAQGERSLSDDKLQSYLQNFYPAALQRVKVVNGEVSLTYRDGTQGTFHR